MTITPVLAKPVLALLIAFALVAAACSSDDPEPETTASSDGTEQATTAPETATDGDDGGEVAADDGAMEETDGDDAMEETDGDQPAPAGEFARSPLRTGPADDSLAPVRIGLLNQENDVVGSFPEFREGVEAGVEYLNAEEGGINGHPIELVSCIQNSPEVAQNCAQELATSDLVSVINGINIWTFAFDFYGSMGDTPVVGGLPLFATDYNADNARYFNGGSVSVYAGMGRFLAEELGAKKVALLSNDNPAATAAVDQGLVPIFEQFGIEWEVITVPLPLTDAIPIITQALAVNADYTVLLASGDECLPIIQASSQLGIPADKMFYSGTCAEKGIFAESGDLMVGSWIQRGGYTREDPWAPADVIKNFDDTTLENYYPAITDTPFAGLGVITLFDIVDLYREVGVENLDDAANIFAVMEDGKVRGSVGGFGWSCIYADIGLQSVCQGANLFVQIADSDGNSAPPPNDGAYVDGLELLGG